MAGKQKRTKEEKRWLKARKERERTEQAIRATNEARSTRGDIRKGWERTDQAIKASVEKLREDAREMAARAGHEIRFDPDNPVKMSEVILDFARPLLDSAKTFEDQRKAVQLAALAWNISLLPKDLKKKSIQDIVMNIAAGDQVALEECNQLFSYLLERRRTLFSGIDRTIVNYDIIETPDGIHVNVTSSFREDNEHGRG